MQNKTMRNGIAALAVIAVISAGAVALAGQGMGYGSGERGYGRHNRNADCPYGERFANLTQEQREQLDTERQTFFEATRLDRQDLYAKRLELRAEVAKREPDMKKASSLQKEVSDLRANLDQKRLEHIMAMRKIDPDAGRGFFMDGRGKGRHGRGGGMGYGPGYCRE